MKNIIAITSLLAAGTLLANADIVLESAALNVLTEITPQENWGGDWQIGGEGGTLIDKTNNDTSPGTGTLSFTFKLDSIPTEGTYNLLTVSSNAPWQGQSSTMDKCGYGFFLDAGALVFARTDVTIAGAVSIDDNKQTILPVADGLDLYENFEYSISLVLNKRGSMTLTYGVSGFGQDTTTVTGFGLNGNDFHSIFVGMSNGLSGTLGNISISPLTLIPEPSAFGLLAGLGALALAGTRRRRRK